MVGQLSGMRAILALLEDTPPIGLGGGEYTAFLPFLVFRGCLFPLLRWWPSALLVKTITTPSPNQGRL